MKKKKYIKIACGLIFFTSISIFCMNNQPSKGATNYFAECKTVNDDYEIKWREWLTSLNEYNVETKMNVAQQRIQEHKQNLSDDKKARLAALKKRYNIDDKIWGTALWMLQDLKKFNKELRKTSSFQGAHDSKMPKWFFDLIKKELTERGHNPACVNLEGADELDCVISSPLYSFSLSEGGFRMKQEIYGGIKINYTMLLKNFPWDDFQRGYCMYVVKVMQKLGMLPFYQAINSIQIPNVSRVKVPEIELEMLKAADSKRGLYQVAFRNEDSARCIASYYSSLYGDESSHSIADYKCLKDIHFHFRCIAWLKEYCT